MKSWVLLGSHAELGLIYFWYFRENEELGLTGIAFCGGSNVRCYSTILEPGMKSKKSIGIRLTTFRQSIRLGEFANFAFMYACCGRGKHLYKKENVETGVFKELFPQVPILGIFSLGEAGVNCVGQNDPSFDPSEIQNIQLSYSTVIALIAVDWNKKIFIRGLHWLLLIEMNFIYFEFGFRIYFEHNVFLWYYEGVLYLFCT